jgi:flavin prenyltransferase
MTEQKKNIVIAVTGASGSVYAKNLLQSLSEPHIKEKLLLSLIFTDTGKDVAIFETGTDFSVEFKIKTYENSDFYAPFASGSSPADVMIVIPCSMGTLGRIAHGTSDNLICRAADVVLKERKKLILVTRETPLNLIHIKNMELLTLAGGIIMPASPSFYSKPKSLDAAINTVINRVLDLAEIETDYMRWGNL